MILNGDVSWWLIGCFVAHLAAQTVSLFLPAAGRTRRGIGIFVGAIMVSCVGAAVLADGQPWVS